MPHWLECLTENVFTWIDAGTGEEMSFAVDRILPWCVDTQQQIYDTPVETEWARRFCRDRGIERHRIERTTPDDLKVPILYLNMPGDTQLLVDGHHRYVYAALTGFKWLPAYILTQEQWEPFIMTGLPKSTEEDLKTRFSGIF